MKTTAFSVKALCVIALLSVSASLDAQEEREKELARELTLEREYAPSVQDANKVNTLPAVKEPVVTKTPIDYAFLSVPFDPPKEARVLPAGQVMADLPFNYRRGYLNIGAGTYLNLNGDVGYHILSTAKDQLNAFYSHRSTNGNVKYLDGFLKDEKVKAKLNDNLGGLFFRHQFDKSALTLQGKYGYTAFNYYGLPALSIYNVRSKAEADMETNQVNQQITVNAGLVSEPGSIVGYHFDIDYTRLSYKYGFDKLSDGIAENSIGFHPGMSATFGGNQRVGVDAAFDYFHYALPDSSIASFENYLETTLTPYYAQEGESWNFKLGANVMLITGDYSTLFVSPAVHFDITAGDKTVLYVDANGGIRSNSAFQLSRENRYIDPYDKTLPSRTPLDAVAGVKSGAIMPGLWVNLFGEYKITFDDYFFIPYRMPEGFGNMSRTLPLDATLLRVGLDMKYVWQKRFEVNLKGVLNHWEVKNTRSAIDILVSEWKPYGRPVAEVKAGFVLRPIEKLSLNLDYYLGTGRQVRESWNEKMKDINELNFTGSYVINDTFGAYIKLNNLLFQRYELIYGYPLQGFNVMAGININF